MGVLTARLNKIENDNIAAKATVIGNGTPAKMWSADGAMFQEMAIAELDYKGSAAHKMIGGLVTAINNNEISLEKAFEIYRSALAA